MGCSELPSKISSIQ